MLKNGTQDVIRVGDNEVDRFYHISSFYTGSGDDVLDFSNDNSIINVNGRGGNDFIIAGPNGGDYAGGDGNDTLIGGAGPDSLYGQVGADTFFTDQPSEIKDADSQDVTASTRPPTPQVDPVGGEVSSAPLEIAQPSTLIAGVLNIGSTNGDDQITIFLRATNSKMLEVNVNGLLSAYRVKDISSIIVNGGNGNDTIKFNEAFGKITITSKIYGGFGDDNITGGSGSDRIYGGDGNDWISGGAGNDVIYGEAGDDRIFGGDGKDYLVGGAGTNVIRGEAGVDRIFANKLLDDFRGNAGDNILDDL